MTRRSLCLLAWLTSTATATEPPVPNRGDPVRGALLAERCASCHALSPDDRARWGPSLHGVVDRPMGAEADYRYGRYLREQAEAGTTWTEAALRQWLVDSKAVARAADARTKMPAQRLTELELDDLVAFLRTLR